MEVTNNEIELSWNQNQFFDIEKMRSSSQSEIKRWFNSVQQGTGY